MLGVSLFQLRWDTHDNNIANPTAVGWGVNFSGREYFGSHHYFRWMTSYGQGWGSNIVATIGSAASAVLDDKGNLETMPAWNLGGGVSINILDNVTSNLNINYFALDPSEFRDENKIKRGISSHLNLIWAPVRSVNAGAEFMLLERTNGDDRKGTGRRIQMMVKYLF